MELTLENYEIDKTGDSYDYDMILINLPASDLMVPPTAPAILKGIAQSHGFKVLTHDFNVDIHKIFCESKSEKYQDLQNYWIAEGPHSQELHNHVKQIYDYIIDWLAQYSTKFIGISVFSVWTHIATWEFCNRVKERYPNWKIVLGGKGLTTGPYINFWSKLTKIEKLMQFHEIIMKKKLVYHTILGDAEDSLLEFLNGKLYSPDFWNTTSNITLSYPFSNFDDYDFDNYKGIASRLMIPVISSKGCVRSCDFCDVSSNFSKFQSKNGTRLAEEIIYLSQKYNRNEFVLSDSIANGNMKALSECLIEIAKYNDSLTDNKIKISGNWISRPPNSIKPEFFNLMIKAGFNHVTIGAESGSDKVLKAMDKKTTVDGLFYELNHMRDVGIGAIINNIVGHWSEEFSDFLLHLDMILKLGPFIANRTVTAVDLGQGYATLRNTPATDNTEKNKLITSDDNFSFFWYTPINPNLTIKARIARWYIIYRLGYYLGLPVYSQRQQVIYMQTRLNESFEKGRDFILNNVDQNNYDACPSIALLENWQDYIDKRTQELFPSTKVVLEVDSGHCFGGPQLFIKYNGETLYRSELPEGNSTVNVEIKYNFVDQSQIEIGMDNKNANDTQVDKQGHIVADKRILFNSIKIDDIDILKNSNYYYNQLEYKENNVKLPISRPGFFMNSQLNIKFQAPYWKWYIKDQLTEAMNWQNLNDNNQIGEMLEKIKSFVYRYEY